MRSVSHAGVFPWFLWLLLGLLIVSPSGAASSVVAEVGGIPVTIYELQREFQRMIPMQVSFHGGISKDKLTEIQQKAHIILIDRAYKVRYALAEEISVDNELVEERIAAVKGKFPDLDAFVNALGDEGVAEFRASIYRSLLADKAEEVAVDSQVMISDEDVARFYEEHRASYLRPHQFKASQILVKVDPASNKEERKALRERAELLLERARAGEDFYDLAYYNSDDRSKYVGGDLGYFHEGQIAFEFEEALKKLKPGEISDVVQTLYGYHVIKLVESNEPRQLTFDEVTDRIRKNLEKETRDTLYEEWMQSLRMQYPVKKIEP
jgi:parvulin-like peptidyl-prolyl isomerase